MTPWRPHDLHILRVIVEENPHPHLKVTLPLSCCKILAPALAIASSFFICSVNMADFSAFALFCASDRPSSTQSMKRGHLRERERRGMKI